MAEKIAMDKQFESLYHTLEDNNWWFLGRHDFVVRYLKKHKVSRDSSILDIGCGSGALMARLVRSGYTNVYGMDISEEAINGCKKRGLTNVCVADAAQPLPFQETKFSLIIASDVLEHLSQPTDALTSWRNKLEYDGRVIIFVPAFNALWGAHDELNHHRMRYTKKTLLQQVNAANLQPLRITYWNFFLFAPYALYMATKKALKNSDDPLKKQGPLLNWLFTKLLIAENTLIHQGISLPFGVSCCCIVTKQS